MYIGIIPINPGYADRAATLLSERGIKNGFIWRPDILPKDDQPDVYLVAANLQVDDLRGHLPRGEVPYHFADVDVTLQGRKLADHCGAESVIDLERPGDISRLLE